MKMKYKIRQAEPEDIIEIIRLCAEHAEFEASEYSPEGKAEELERHLFKRQPRIYCLLAESMTGQILGYATFMKEFSTWDAGFYVHMDCLFLRPNARNLGIGEHLINEIAKASLKLNCKQIQWQTPASNDRAIRFYYRMGATSRQKVRLYLDEKAIRILAKANPKFG